MTETPAVDPEPAKAGGLSLEEAVRQVHLLAGRLGRAQRALSGLMRAVKLPSEAEFREMREGDRPLSPEAHLIGALRRTIKELEICEEELRLAVEPRIFDRLGAEWKRGWLPHRVELQHIEAAVAALRDGTGVRR